MSEPPCKLHGGSLYKIMVYSPPHHKDGTLVKNIEKPEEFDRETSFTKNI